MRTVAVDEHRTTRRPMRGGSPSREVTIHVGEIHVSRTPVIVRTLLGSCIAVCLWDGARRIGGMNHFLLPDGDPHHGASARFGGHAMERLIGAMLELGADRRRLVAKIFGGANVLEIPDARPGVPEWNVAFIREFFAREPIPVLAEDLGGSLARVIRFDTTTNRVQVRRVARPRARVLWGQAEGRVSEREPFTPAGPRS